MALFETTQYYYFRMRNGQPYDIKVSSIQINTVIMRNFQEFTQEQKEFYLENPTASVQEVWDCQLTPPYVPPTPDVQEYANDKVKELKEACYNAVTITALEYAMAEDKLNNITASCYYDITEARQVISDFRTQTKAVMQVFDTYKPQIEAASTINAIDSLYEQAIEAL